jgi:hypothetical protein
VSDAGSDDAHLKSAGFDRIAPRRAPTIQALAAQAGPLQLSFFDERDMLEITADDYRDERHLPA